MNIGKYTNRPQIFNQLIEIDQLLEQEGYSLNDNLGFILELDEFSYECTPYDVITFATIGCDGIHFGVVTDFGQVKDLDDAFVVCVSPMDFDAPIKLVARNMREFLDLLCTVKDASVIANFQYMESKEEYVELLAEIVEDDEFMEQAKYVTKRIKQTIGYKEIDDVYEYVKVTVPTEREQQIILPTKDGLGVTPFEQIDKTHIIYPLEADMEMNLTEIQAFFKTATIESKLAFIRDAQETRLINDDEDIRHITTTEMKALGLKDELERLKRCFDS